VLRPCCVERIVTLGNVLILLCSVCKVVEHGLRQKNELRIKGSLYLQAFLVAHSERFELPTLGIEIRCSIQLSYECVRLSIG
jgi:hypothetical protein